MSAALVHDARVDNLHIFLTPVLSSSWVWAARERGCALRFRVWQGCGSRESCTHVGHTVDVCELFLALGSYEWVWRSSFQPQNYLCEKMVNRRCRNRRLVIFKSYNCVMGLSLRMNSGAGDRVPHVAPDLLQRLCRSLGWALRSLSARRGADRGSLRLYFVNGNIIAGSMWDNARKTPERPLWRSCTFRTIPGRGERATPAWSESLGTLSCGLDSWEHFFFFFFKQGCFPVPREKAGRGGRAHSSYSVW